MAGTAEQLYILRNDKIQEPKKVTKKIKIPIIKATELFKQNGSSIKVHDVFEEKSELQKLGIKYLDQPREPFFTVIRKGILEPWEIMLLQIIEFKTNIKDLDRQYWWVSVTFLSKIFKVNKRTIMNHVTDNGDNSMQDRGWVCKAGRYPTSEESPYNPGAFGIQLTPESRLFLKYNKTFKSGKKR